MDKRLIVLGATAIGSAAVGLAAGYELAKRRLTATYDAQLENDREAIKWSYEQLAKTQKAATVEEEIERRTAVVREGPMEAREDEPSIDLLLRVREGLKNWDTGERAVVKAHAGEAMVAYSAGAATADTVAEVLDRFPKPSLLGLGDQFQDGSHDDDDEDPLSLNHRPENIFDADETPMDDILAIRGNGSRPYVLHRDEFLTAEPGYAQLTLTYYSADGVLVDEADRAIDDHEIDRVVGRKNLSRFGMGSGDKRIVYIRNPRLEADYEVLFHETSYQEVVHGMPMTETFEKMPKRNKNRNNDN